MALGPVAGGNMRWGMWRPVGGRGWGVDCCLMAEGQEAQEGANWA